MTVSRALILSGLCIAVALRRVGIDAQVFEQADSLREVGAGPTIWTKAAKVLCRMG
jgi:salicylate hydroxylase